MDYEAFVEIILSLDDEQITAVEQTLKSSQPQPGPRE